MTRSRGIRSIPMATRFWSKVDKNGPVPKHNPELGPCWVWTAGRFMPRNNGAFSIGGKNKIAHRVAWKLLRGDPGNAQLNHHCDNSLCVNPDHVYLGTQLDNMRDRKLRGGDWACHRGSRKLSREQIFLACDLYFGSDRSLQSVASEIGNVRYQTIWYNICDV